MGILKYAPNTHMRNKKTCAAEFGDNSDARHRFAANKYFVGLRQRACPMLVNAKNICIRFNVVVRAVWCQGDVN